MKDHTVKQIREHLQKREIPVAEIDTIIKKLSDYDLLNDEKYCQNKTAALSMPRSDLIVYSFLCAIGHHCIFGINKILQKEERRILCKLGAWFLFFVANLTHISSG